LAFCYIEEGAGTAERLGQVGVIFGLEKKPRPVKRIKTLKNWCGGK